MPGARAPRHQRPRHQPPPPEITAASQGYDEGGLPAGLELGEDGRARWQFGHRADVDGDRDEF